MARQVPGLKNQGELFRDVIGHATEPLQMLNVYCHYAVTYRRSPVGLPLPALLKRAKNPNWDEKLNRLLQELAWDAVVKEPLSGVKALSSISSPHPYPPFNGEPTMLRDLSIRCLALLAVGMLPAAFLGLPAADAAGKVPWPLRRSPIKAGKRTSVWQLEMPS